MREIKFRAWDKKSGTMMSWEKLKDHYQDFIVGLMDTLDEEYPLMQYTGLHDRNGKEIYEGDIMKFQMTRTKLVDHPVIIAFEDETAIYQGSVKWGEFGWRPFVDGKTTELEVIGNIYENRELLK